MEADDYQKLEAVTEVSRRRITINAIANYSRYGTTMVVAIVLQAYMVRKLGRDGYALWPIIGTCTSFLALIPQGIGAGTARFLAHALGSKKLKEVEEITSSLLVALLVAAAIHATCIIVLSAFFERIFDIPEGTAGIGPWVILLAGLGASFSIPFSVFRGGLIASQNYVAKNALAIGLSLLRLILVVSVFSLGIPNLIWIGGIALLLEVVESLTLFKLARRVVPWQRFRWSAFNWQMLGKVSSFSGWVLLANISMLLYWKTDNVIINKLLDPGLLTGYAVVTAFVVHSSRATALGSGVLYPVATVLHGRNDLPRMARMLYRANRIVVPLAVPLLLFLIIFGPELLSAYIGEQYAHFAVLFPILAGAAIISVTQAAATCVPQALNRMALFCSASLAAAIANVLLSLFFVVRLQWGLVGVAAGTGIVVVLVRGLWAPWYASYLLQVPYPTYVRKAVLLPLANCIPVGCTMLAVRLWPVSNIWAHLVAALVCGGIVHVLFMLRWGLPEQERRTVLKLLRLGRKRLEKNEHSS